MRTGTRTVLAFALLVATTGALAQTLHWAAQGDPQTMDPHSHNELLTNSMNGQVYETLVKRDKDLGLAPALAVSWQQTGPTVWRMVIREGVKFHDGTDFNADDVIFSVARAKTASSGIRSSAMGLGEPRKVDAQTIEFQLARVNPIFLQHASLVPIMSKVWCEKHDARDPQDFKNKEARHTALHANGTGPFALVSRQPDVQTVYKRNNNWWGHFDGNVQEVIYTPIKSDPTRSAALLSGHLDFVLDPPVQDIDRLRSTPGIKVKDGVENRIIFVGMDQQRDELLYSGVKGRNPFKDLRVRRALYHAVDIEGLRSRLMRGQSLPTGSITPSPLGSFNGPEIEARLPFDPPRARALMAEAGYPDGFDVTMDCPNNRYINDERICVALAGMWAQVGVRVTVKAQPRTLYFAKLEKQDVSMYLLGWGSAITDAEATFTPVLRSRGEGGVGYYNFGGYSNNRLDELAVASANEADPAKRELLIKSALLEHNAQVHHIPLHRQVIPWAMRSNVDVVHRADNWLEWPWITIKPPGGS
ncbi:ABC transporter substrate-binding protein [Variovorax sp. WS11]|nr:ABC transporter substrate-binding protein [Variovorax sp. WS11]NDZ13331.1 ABC transporter substrate-binding protein [Variovorax sp. WS11]PSL79674.1 ABC transporter substrate-binding protein [Variovorax sp. WS11]